MNPRRLHFTTRTWFQLCMLPALALVTVGLAWSVYRSLHDIILHNFEQKLVAVSTTTAAFVKAEDHQWLLQKPDITGIAFSPDDVLFALDRSRRVLMRIRGSNGVAEDRVVPVPPGLKDLAYHRASGVLIALEVPAGRLLSLDPETGASTPLLTVGPSARGLVAAAGGQVMVLADRLLRLDLAAKRVEPVSEFRLPPTLGAGFDADHNVIWAIDAKHRILKIDPETGRTKVNAHLPENSPLPGDLAYDRRRHILLGCHTAMVKIDPEKGTIEPAHFLSAFGKEISPIYRNYALPMSRVMHELDLSYVYTLTVSDRTHIVYGLDGTQGEKHSPLQSEDVLPDEQAKDVQELYRNGTIFITPIQRWQQWGQLKSTFAPIFDAAGKVVAMAGTDVEVSLIERQTRAALIDLLSIGILSLVAASAVAIVIARRLRRPLALIKSTALEVAAGNYSRRVSIDTPREAQALGVAFNGAAASLETSMAALHSSIRELLRKRDRYELGRRLAQPHEPSRLLADMSGIRVAWRDPIVAATNANGAAQLETKTAVWFATSPADPLEAARCRADLALRVAARLRNAGESAAMPMPGHTSTPFASAAARGALPAGVTLALLIDHVARTVHAIVARGSLAGIEELPGGEIRCQDGELTVTLTGFTLSMDFA